MTTANTCEGCMFLKRVGDRSEHRDLCFERPGEPVVRQRSDEYWPDYPPACSKRQEIPKPVRS